MKKRMGILVMLVALVATANAVPARKGWHTLTQPDGSEIEVQLVGDEWFHFYMNRDGKKVRQNDAGFWVVISDDEFDKGRDAQRTTISAPRRHTMQVGETFNPAVRTNSNGAISFYTDDPDIVSIDPMMGIITALKAGWTQVVVEVGSTRMYRHATRTIRIKVVE